MNEVPVRPEDAVGTEVTVRIERGDFRGCGQGGVLEHAGVTRVSVRGPNGTLHHFLRANVSVWQEQALSTEDCLEHGGPTACVGAVDYREPLSATGRSFPRCEGHWAAALDRWEQTQRRYGGVLPPADFDPAYAGERWDEDY